MSEQPEALRIAEWFEGGYGGCESEAAAELRRLHNVVERLLRERRINLDGGIRDTERIANLEALNAELLEALKSTGLFLHHCWCDVQMNDYSFEKLNQQMAIVAAAVAKGEQA